MLRIRLRRWPEGSRTNAAHSPWDEGNSTDSVTSQRALSARKASRRASRRLRLDPYASLHRSDPHAGDVGAEDLAGANRIPQALRQRFDLLQADAPASVRRPSRSPPSAAVARSRSARRTRRPRRRRRSRSAAGAFRRPRSGGPARPRSARRGARGGRAPQRRGLPRRASPASRACACGRSAGPRWRGRARSETPPRGNRRRGRALAKPSSGRARVTPSTRRARRHARQAADAGAAQQAEQRGLRLVVEVMAR